MVIAGADVAVPVQQWRPGGLSEVLRTAAGGLWWLGPDEWGTLLVKRKLLGEEMVMLWRQYPDHVPEEGEEVLFQHLQRLLHLRLR